MLRSYQVLGVISVTAGTVVELRTAFATKLDPSKGNCYVNTLYLQAHEGNGSDLIYVGDLDMLTGNDDTRGIALAAREYVAFTCGTTANSVDPRDFAVDASAGTKKVRVLILKV